MTRTLRGASKNASNAVKQDTSTDALKKPLTRRNAKVNKENVPSTKVKNSRKAAVQPLQEKNSATKVEKANKQTTLSLRTTDTDGLSSKNQINSSNVTKRTNTIKKPDNVKPIRLEENTVDAQLSDRPVAREKPYSPAVTNKRNLSPENIGVCPARLTRRQQKTAIALAASFSPVSNIHKKSPTVQTPTKNVIIPSTRARRGDEKTKSVNKALATSYATVRRKRSQQPDAKIPTTSDRDNIENNQFVTKRKRGRNSEPIKTEANETIQTKESVTSNITKRRKDKATISVSTENEMKIVTEGVTRRKRLQTVNVTNQKETNAHVGRIDTVDTPMRKRNGKKNKVEKIDRKLTKQPELSVHASAVSEKTNSSALPVYKRIRSNNNKTANGVFDFESNSQEIKLEKDVQMQEVYAKLVRENKASVIKPKRNAKKGVTKSKTTVARSTNKIEKIRSELKDHLNELNSIVATRKMTTSKLIPKPQTHTLHEESFQFAMQDEVNSVDLGVEEIAMEIPSDKHDEKETDNQQISRQEVLPDISIKTNVVNKGSSEIRELSPHSANTSVRTPTRLQTYAAANPIFQSTPVQIAKLDNGSPWRVPALNELKYSNDVFSRYTTFEKSPIKNSEISKIPPRQVTNQPTEKMHPQPPKTTDMTDNLRKIEKSKDLTNDLKNYFGFDNDDLDDDFPTRPSLPAVNTSFGITKLKSLQPKSSLKSKRSPWLKIPQAISSIRQELAKLKDGQKSSVVETLEVRDRETFSQSKISTHFGGKKTKLTSRESVGGFAPNKMKECRTVVKKQKIETTTRTQDWSENTPTYTEIPTLFDISWLERKDEKHRSYSRVPKREYKRPFDRNHILTDDEIEFGGSVSQVRTKRTKPKDKQDDKQEELRKFEEICNSDFLEVDKFEIIMEKST